MRTPRDEDVNDVIDSGLAISLSREANWGRSTFRTTFQIDVESALSILLPLHHMLFSGMPKWPVVGTLLVVTTASHSRPASTLLGASYI